MRIDGDRRATDLSAGVVQLLRAQRDIGRRGDHARLIVQRTGRNADATGAGADLALLVVDQISALELHLRIGQQFASAVLDGIRALHGERISGQHAASGVVQALRCNTDISRCLNQAIHVLHGARRMDGDIREHGLLWRRCGRSLSATRLDATGTVVQLTRHQCGLAQGSNQTLLRIVQALSTGGNAERSRGLDYTALIVQSTALDVYAARSRGDPAQGIGQALLMGIDRDRACADLAAGVNQLERADVRILSGRDRTGLIVQGSGRNGKGAVAGRDVSLLIVSETAAGELHSLIGTDLPGTVDDVPCAVEGQRILRQQLALAIVNTCRLCRDVVLCRDDAASVDESARIQGQCAIAGNLPSAVVQAAACSHRHAAAAALSHGASGVVQHGSGDAQGLVRRRADALNHAAAVGNAVCCIDRNAARVAADGAGFAGSSAVVQCLAVQADVALRG